MWNPQEPSLLKALKVEGYRDIEYLASGGMSWIYRATDKEKRPVCLKLLSVEELLENPSQAQELCQRFQQERNILFDLNHPHIVRAMSQGMIEVHKHEIPFYAMEYCGEGSLYDRLEKRREERTAGLAIEEALRIFGKIAGAVAYLHEKGYIHRDIKPQNILFVGEEPKLADLGLAKNPREDITRRGDELGTPAYLAPEQRLGQDADQRADIYAMGLVLYEMVEGEIFHRQSSGFAERMAPLIKKSPKIARICYQMLAPRDMRLQTMQEVVRMIGTLNQSSAPSKLWFWKQNRMYKKRFQDLENYIRQTRRGLEIIVDYLGRNVRPEELLAEMGDKLSGIPPYLVAQELAGFLDGLNILQLKVLAESFCKFNLRWIEEIAGDIPVSERKKSAFFFLVMLFLIEPDNQKLWNTVRGRLQEIWPYRKLNALWKLVHGPDRLSAAEQLNCPMSLPALIWALEHGHWKVCEVAAKNLTAIGPFGSDSVPVLKQAMAHEQWRLRKSAIEALGAMGEHAVQAIPELIEALRDSYPEVREAAVTTLGMIGPQAHAAMPILIEAMKDARWEMRRAAALALGKIKVKQAVPELTRALKEGNREVQRAAAGALGGIGPAARAAVPKLKEIIAEDENLKPRESRELQMYEAAEMALIEIGESAVAEYIEGLHDENWKVRWAMAYIIGKLKAREAAPELCRLLRDESWEVRENAAWALGKIGAFAHQAVNDLIATLHDENWKVRAAAALALGKVGSKEAVSGLRHALKDDNPAVWRNAAVALAEIEGG